MKKITYILTLLAAALTVSCRGEEDKLIEEAAYGYCITTSNYDIDAAEQYCTPESANQTLRTARMLMQYVDSAYIASDSPVSIDIKSVRRLSDTTASALYHKRTPHKDYVDTLHLRKRDGQWLVHTL